MAVTIAPSTTRASAAPPLRCAPFAAADAPAPAPRRARWPVETFAHIRAEVAAHAYNVLVLGDSLTQRYAEVPEDRRLWERYFRPFDALNAGVDGDRTEHLLWRLQHGNLDNQRPRAVVLLIGTNDLAAGRWPPAAAEGVRRVLLELRRRLPATRILLEGLWPRRDQPRFAAGITPVNRLIRQCADGARIVYRDPGRLLLDAAGRLTPAMAPDGLHPGPAGYRVLSPAVAGELGRLLAGR